MNKRQKGKVVGFGVYGSNGIFRLHVNDQGGRRRTLRLRSLGITTQKKAQEVANCVGALISARNLAEEPSADLLQAIKGYCPRIQKFLRVAGLIPQEMNERTLHQCLDEFLEAKREQCKQSSMDVLGRGVTDAKGFFPASRLLHSVTAMDVQQFSSWMKSKPGKQSPKRAQCTVGKSCGVLSQMFNFAMRHGWVRRNVVVDSGVKRTAGANVNRLHHVSRDDARKLLAACESEEERLMVGFARFAAFRMPSEISQLRWSNFGNDFNTVEVFAPKTSKWRTVPVMPELRELLLQTGVPSDLSEFVFPRLRMYPSLSTLMRRVIRRSGISEYPRALHNLRSSCITDWVRQHDSIAEVAEWSGHSVPVMTRHYIVRESKDSALRAAKAAQRVASRDSGGGAETVKAA